MTTIAWDGTTLAADSRRTTGKHHRDDALKIVPVRKGAGKPKPKTEDVVVKVAAKKATRKKK